MAGWIEKRAEKACLQRGISHVSNGMRSEAETSDCIVRTIGNREMEIDQPKICKTVHRKKKADTPPREA